MSGRGGRHGIQTGGKMIQRQTRTLVVDDNQEEGDIILKALAEAGCPARFIVYQGGMDWSEEKMVGIRTILMDLALIGSGTVSESDRSATQSLLEQMLDANNGPWGLVTWTSHAADGEQLYNHLRNRMPAGLRPVTYAILDKEQYLAVKRRVGRDDMTSLVEDVKAKLIPPKAVACLMNWEIAVHRAAASVLHQLTQAADNGAGNNNPQEKLACLLLELAKAEAGQTLPPQDSLITSLYAVLTPLLTDSLDQANHPDCLPPAHECQDAATSEWKHRINRMLHLDSTAPAKILPGALIELDTIPTGIQQLDTLGITKETREEAITQLFSKLSDTPEKTEKRRQAAKNCRVFIMDITPGCDHAQNRAEKHHYWRRFMVLYRLPSAHGKAAEKADNLYFMPEFLEPDGSSYFFIANANQVVALTQAEIGKLSKPVQRIREQLFNYILSWVGKHISRQGIVSLG